MLELINVLNKAGSGFCGFALAMLIQSGILIVLLYLLDLAIRKHVRAVFRYCIWMLVFVKLILPVSLSSPVSMGQLLGDKLTLDKKAPAPAAAQIDLAARAVLPEFPARPALSNPLDAAGNETKAAEWPRQVQQAPITPVQNAQIAPPPVALTWQAVVFLIWLVGVLVLSVLLFQRFLFVKGLLAQSDIANGRLDETLRQCCKLVGIRGHIEFRLSKNMLSPAACGLYKPVILMPASLLANLSREKLRAVLIHELAHIKRGDLWVNFLQTILQIVYFYNPLLWFANAVVRGIREKAVDEMVLTKLGDEAASYSSTLIDIAEIAFSRPHFSLRLVGVVESKKALTDRIKHIISRPIPKTAKLGIVGFAAIILVGCALLPMAKAEKEIATETTEDTEIDVKNKSEFKTALVNGEKEFTAKVTLPYSFWMADIGIDDVMKILDFASGEIVELSGFKKGKDFIERIDSTPKGDVFVSYAKESNKPFIAFLKGAGLKGEAATNENIISSLQIMELPWQTTVTTRQGHKYLFSVINFDANECTIEYQPLNEKAKKAMAKAEKENNNFQKTLPNGVTVELVGLGTAPWKTEQQWWKPDGTNVNQPALKFPYLFQWKDEPNGYQFASTALCKFSNYTGKEISVPEVKFSNKGILTRVWGTDFTADGYEMTYIAHEPRIGMLPDKTDMRLAVGSREFVQAKRLGNFTPQQHMIHYLEKNSGQIILHPVRIGGLGTPCVDLTCNQENKEIEFRVFAKLKNGETERWRGGSVGKDVLFFQSTPKRQNITIEDIEDIIIEFRPYEWVEFKNVSLKSDLKPAAQVEAKQTAKNTEIAVSVIEDKYARQKLTPEQFSSNIVLSLKTGLFIPKQQADESKEPYLYYCYTFPPGANPSKYSVSNIPEAYIGVSAANMDLGIGGFSPESESLDYLWSVEAIDKLPKFPPRIKIEGPVYGQAEGIDEVFIHPPLDRNWPYITAFKGDDGTYGVFEVTQVENRDISVRYKKINYLNVTGEVSDTLKTTLSNGVTVELAGVCEYDVSGGHWGSQWWRPDGSLLEKAPIDTNQILVLDFEAAAGRRTLIAAVKVENFNESIDIRFRVERVGQSGSTGTEEQKENIIIFDQAKGSAHTNIRIGIASGTWETVKSKGKNLRGINSYDEVTLFGAVETDGKTILNITHKMTEKNARVIAIDKQGKQHTSGSFSSVGKNDVENTQNTFNLPLSEIKEFQFQARPYEWVEFKNVSLKPDFKTDAQVEAKPAASIPQNVSFGPVIEREAPPGRFAIEFDGVDDYLEIHASESLKLGRHFTIQMWIKPEFPDTGTPDNDRTLLAKGGNILGHPDERGNRQAGTYGFGFQLRAEDNSRIALTMSTGNGGIYSGTNIFKYESGWHHMVICSRENGGASGDINYIHNGEQPYEPAPLSNIIVGGEFLTPAGNHFKGQIAELRIWNRSLTADEIAAFKNTALTGNEPNLVGCWTFEQGQGQRIKDISSYKNDASLGSSYAAEDCDPAWVTIGEEAKAEPPAPAAGENSK